MATCTCLYAIQEIKELCRKDLPPETSLAAHIIDGSREGLSAIESGTGGGVGAKIIPAFLSLRDTFNFFIRQSYSFELTVANFEFI